MNNGKPSTDNGKLTTPNAQLPPVDFSDINDIAGSARLLITVANKTGERNNAAAREWLSNVQAVLPSLSPGDALCVADSYEAVHNLLYPAPSIGKNPTSDITTSCRIKAFEALVSGDKSVDRYRLRNAISCEIDRRNPKFLGKPLQWESICIDRWYRQFQYGVAIDDLSGYDTINRVTSLLTSDLWAFETRNQSRFKQTLFENHKHYLESMHNAQCIMHNVKSMHNAKSIQNAKCIMHNVKSMQNAESMHNAQCIMHNVKSMHNAESMQNQCRMQNESQAESPDYALCIMNYELINALPSFLLASAPYLTPGEYTAYDTQIRTALYNHPATNRFQKASLAITLSN